jgi:chemotaxis protein methyltransferase CheR
VSGQPSGQDVERFRSAVERRFGLYYEDAKLDYLAQVLRRRANTSASAAASDYVARIHSGEASRVELAALVEELTVTETYFFRNPDNFRALSERVLPACTHSRGGQRRLRILSAGCASGEEPYTLALLLRESLPDWQSWDLEITGIDVNPVMLSRAAQARYSTWSLRATPDDVRERHFKSVGREFELDPQVRKMVTFEERNLVDEAPSFWQPEYFDVVFCRNVMMYFLPDVTRRVVSRFSRSLRPEGFLFLGHAETLRSVSNDFHLCHTHDTFYYQRRGELVSSEMLGSSTSRLPEIHYDVASSGVSWVHAIQNSSDRIAALAAAAPEMTTPRPLLEQRQVRSARDLQWVFEAIRQERYTDALGRLLELPEELAGAADVLLIHAILLVNTGQLAASELVCARLLALDELNAGAHYVMALCREHAGEVSAAIEHDRTAMYLDAAFAMPHLHLGLLAKRTGDVVTACSELSHALRLLAGEDSARLLLFGGGFSRDALLGLCSQELRAAGGKR